MKGGTTYMDVSCVRAVRAGREPVSWFEFKPKVLRPVSAEIAAGIGPSSPFENKTLKTTVA